MQTLGIDEQRQVLGLATKLSKSGNRSDVSVADLDMEDDAAWDAWSERTHARSAKVLEDEKQRLQGLGLIHEDWSARTADLPEDMLASSKTSVET
ncbi:MAG: hypothetical protein R3B70_21125 [Polyangiaceae bacterium]